MLNLKEKELFDKKISYSDSLFLRCLQKANIPADKKVVIYLAFWNSPRGYYTCKKLFPKATVKIVEDRKLKDLYNIDVSDIIYIDTEKEKFPMVNELKDIYVIANPPYSKIGAVITKHIIDKVDFKEYINLLPMVDYEKVRNQKVWTHVDLSSVTPCPGAFGEDAAISPLICRISKSKTNDLTADEFRLACLENKLTVKYFEENLKRTEVSFKALEQFPGIDLKNTIALPLRVKSGNHSGEAKLGKTAKSQFYQINNGYKSTVTTDELKSICCTTITFNTQQEKLNVASLLYSNIGYKFASWLMTGMNRDAFHLREHTMWFPKVDWTRSWTVEEILEDYGYTEDEIKAVLVDLSKFKGMGN